MLRVSVNGKDFNSELLLECDAGTPRFSSWPSVSAARMAEPRESFPRPLKNPGGRCLEQAVPVTAIRYPPRQPYERALSRMNYPYHQDKSGPT